MGVRLGGPPAPRPRETGPRETEAGAALVEMAIVLPVLMVLILGMITGAMAWNQSQALGQGARMAARAASTVPLPASADDQGAWLDAVIDSAVAASEGQLGTAVAGRSVCVAYVDPAGASADQTISRRLDAAGTRTTGTTVCFDDGQADTEKRVQVVVQRDGHIDTGFHRFPMTIRRSAVYRFEADGGL